MTKPRNNPYTDREIEALWKRAVQEYPDLAKNMAEILGPRWARVNETQTGITGKTSPATAAAPPPGPAQKTWTMESMRAELEEKMRRLQGR